MNYSPLGERRAAVIGAGSFSPVQLYSLASAGAVEELLLVGDDPAWLAGLVQECNESFPVANNGTVVEGDIAAAAGTRFVVIADAGDGGLPESELATLRRRAHRVRSIARELRDAGFRGVLLVATNPVDLMAMAALRGSGLPPGHVFGSGRVVDPQKLSILLEAAGRTCTATSEPAELEEPATWCAAHGEGRVVVDYCEPNCPEFGRMLDALERQESAPEPGRPPVGGGSCVSRICRAVMLDERVVLPACTLAGGQTGITGVFLTMPCVIGKSGVEGVIEPRLSQAEADRLKETEAILNRATSVLDDTTAASGSAGA